MAEMDASDLAHVMSRGPALNRSNTTGAPLAATRSVVCLMHPHGTNLASWARSICACGQQGEPLVTNVTNQPMAARRGPFD